MSNKSKALANKALRRSNKVLANIIRNKDLYISLAKLDSEKGNQYIEENFNENAFEKLNEKLEKFTKEFEDSGGNAEHLQGLVFGSIFLNRELLKDMLKTCK
ncbi:hypothetical protein vB_AbaM_Acibel004_151 [Acinetobacter phage vB_AbaM_Acibel004]|uniref:hypothetical protein n=1 Tax=Acinetobacter phage vB_AbaM_Acibel004 TaxID=1481186 RepID=UPI0004E85F37|nr:hypothetical protein vB_AbaM_Acibel004_151 [Acinetobacter phage vB_AbaM_Acibel004]AHY26766.1 hypothetical protein vB_AbaM_Acibel004_151 [Acinetobacter phage vB_AbaM_Acibel004]